MRDISNNDAMKIIKTWKHELIGEVNHLIARRSLELFHRLKQAQGRKHEEEDHDCAGSERG